MQEFDDYDYGLDSDGTWETVTKSKKTKEKTKPEARAVPVRKPGNKTAKPAGVAGNRRPNKTNTNMAGRKPAPVTDWRAASKKKADASEMQKKVLLKNVQIGRTTKNNPPPLIKEQTVNDSSKTVGERENLSRRRKEVAGKANFDSFQEYNDSFPDLPRTESNEEIRATDQEHSDDHPFYDLNGCDVTADVLRLLNATFLNDQTNLPMLHRPALGELEQLCQPRQEYVMQYGCMENLGYTADDSYTGEMGTMNYNIFPSDANPGAVHIKSQDDFFNNIPVGESKPNALEVQGEGKSHHETKVNNIHQDINLQNQTDFQEKAIAEKHVFGDRKEDMRKGCVKLPVPYTGNVSVTSAKIPTKREKKVKTKTKEPNREIMPLKNVTNTQEDTANENILCTQEAMLNNTLKDGDSQVKLPTRVNKETNLNSKMETKNIQGGNDCKKSVDVDFVTQDSAVANLNVSRSDSNTIFKSDNQNNNCQEVVSDYDESCLDLTGLESQCNPDDFQTRMKDVVITNAKPKTTHKQAKGPNIIRGCKEESRTGATILLQENIDQDKGKAIINMADDHEGDVVRKRTNNDAKCKEEARPAPVTQLTEGNTTNENIVESNDVQAEPKDGQTPSTYESIATTELIDPEEEGSVQRHPKDESKCNQVMAHEDTARASHQCPETPPVAAPNERQNVSIENQDDRRKAIKDRKVIDSENVKHSQMKMMNDAEDVDNATEDVVRMLPSDKGLSQNADQEKEQVLRPKNQNVLVQEPILDKRVTYGEVIDYVHEQLKELYAGKDVNKLSPVIKIEHEPLPDELTRHVSLLRQLSYNYTPSARPNNMETTTIGESSDSDVSDLPEDTKEDAVNDEKDERDVNVNVDGEYMRRFHEKLQMFGRLSHLHQVVSDPRLAAFSGDLKLRGTDKHLIENESNFASSVPSLLGMKSECTNTENVTCSFENRGRNNMAVLSSETGRKGESVDKHITKIGLREMDNEAVQASEPMESVVSRSSRPMVQEEDAQGTPVESEMEEEEPLSSLMTTLHQTSDKGLQFFQRSIILSPADVYNDDSNPQPDSSEHYTSAKENYDQSSNLEDIRHFLSSQLSDMRASLDKEIVGLSRASFIQKEQGTAAWQGGDMMTSRRHKVEDNDLKADHTNDVMPSVTIGVDIDDDDLLGKGWMDRTLVENLENPKDEEFTEKRNRREYRIKSFGVLPYWWMS